MLVLVIPTARSQDTALHVVNVSGGSFKDGSIVYEWSVGELALIDEMRSSDQNVILTNGFIQGLAKKIIKDTLVKPIPANQVTILPNPTRGKLQVNFDMPVAGIAKLTLYDETGFVLFKKEIPSQSGAVSQTILMNNFAAGNYFLVIELLENNNKKRQTYKIIKVH